MEETPKKIVRSDLACFLCACRLNKDKVRVFGTNAVNIPGPNQKCDCTACYKKLIRFEKIASNLRALQRELKENYEKGGLRTKRLRKDSTQEAVTDPMEQSLLSTGIFLSSSSTATKSLKFPTTSSTARQRF